jgi:hypothetical protein
VSTKSWLQKAEDQLGSHALVLHAIEALGKLVKHALVDRGVDAYSVLQAVERMIDTVVAGFDGKVTKDEVEKHLRDLLDRVEANDRAADAALAAKFPGGSGGA